MIWKVLWVLLSVFMLGWSCATGEWGWLVVWSIFLVLAAATIMFPRGDDA